MSRNKLFYSDYVKHMMRFYSRSMDISVFKSSIDKFNWRICQSTLDKYPSHRDMLLDIYSGYGTLEEEVNKASLKYKVEKKRIWDLMKKFERDLAINRGLLE